MSLETLPPAGGLRDGRDSGRTLPPSGEHLLSMVHKTRNPIPSDHPPAAISLAKMFKVWKDGSLAIFPGIPNRNPYAQNPSTSNGGKRGKVLWFSSASRRNLMQFLATLHRGAESWTLALTLPGNFRVISSVKVHLAFKKLCDRFTASGRFPGVAFVWKRELQRRGALHYHLQIFGLASEQQRKDFQEWIALQWNQLICDGIPDEERRHHLWWHRRPVNMEKVRGNFSGYFAKYLGKPVESVFEEIPGRWWGKVNVKALPISACSSMPLPEPAAIFAHRICRKLLRKRANAAKHYAICKTSNLLDENHKPRFSEFALIRARTVACRITKEEDIYQLNPRDKRLFFDFFQPSYFQLKWGKARIRGYARFAPVKLISHQSPATALAILRYVEGATKDWKERNPF